MRDEDILIKTHQIISDYNIKVEEVFFKQNSKRRSHKRKFKSSV